MLALVTLSFLRIKCSNALFETQEGLVDFSSFGLPLFIITLTILCPLTTSKIDKKKFTALFYSFLLYFDLSDGMTSTRSIISFCCMSRSHLVSLFDKLKDMIIIVNELLFEAWYLNQTIFVFLKL